MVAVALVLGVFMLLMFLLIGGLIGYLARDLIYTQSTYPLHPEFFDDEGNEVQKYYGEMKDGSPLPDWIKVDPKTGKTKTDIPKGVKIVEFKIIAIDAEKNKKQVTVNLRKGIPTEIKF